MVFRKPPKLGGMLNLGTPVESVGQDCVQEVLLRSLEAVQMPVVMHVRCGYVFGIPGGVDDFGLDGPQLLWEQSQWEVGLDVAWSGHLLDQGYRIRDFQIGEKCIQRSVRLTLVAVS